MTNVSQARYTIRVLGGLLTPASLGLACEEPTMVYSKTSLPARGTGSGGDSQELRNLGWLGHTRKPNPVDGERRRATLNKALIPLAYSNEPSLSLGWGIKGELYLALTQGSASESVGKINQGKKGNANA